MAKLKRLKAPKFWKVRKKKFKWVIRSKPGPHKTLESIPLLIIIRNILKLADTGKEAKKIITSGEILVDRKKRKDPKFSVGLMDTVSVPKIDKNYRVIPSHKGLDLIEITKKEASMKICRINNKSLVKGNKLQLNLHDGRSILTKNGYKTGDSVLIELPSQKILEQIKLERGFIGLIIKGKNMGKMVKIKDVVIIKGREPNKVICEFERKTMEVIMNYIIVVGKDRPLVKLCD